MGHRSKKKKLNLENFSVCWWFWYQFQSPAREYIQSHTPVPLAQGLAQEYDCLTAAPFVMESQFGLPPPHSSTNLKSYKAFFLSFGPGIAGAVLQTPLSRINSSID